MMVHVDHASRPHPLPHLHFSEFGAAEALLDDPKLVVMISPPQTFPRQEILFYSESVETWLGSRVLIGDCHAVCGTNSMIMTSTALELPMSLLRGALIDGWPFL